MTLNAILRAAALAALSLACQTPALAQQAAPERPHTAGPNVQVIQTQMTIPGLNRPRTIRVYTPPGYATSGKRYPVLYMHDGQNLFDDATSYVGEWGVDEALDALAKEGIELIVVGIDHGGEKRMTELNAWPNPRFGPAEGVAYTDFIVKVLKPWVDRSYRTKPHRRDTGIMGSSMGGLASHYAIYQYPLVFTKAGVFSPAYWTAEPAVSEWTSARRLGIRSRMYFVAGGKEGGDMTGPFDPMVARVRATARGRSSIHAEIIPEGEHNERFWRGEFPKAVRFLYGKD